MATLEYAVTNQEIATTKTAELVKNTIGFYTVKFTFTGDVWSGLSERWAVFDPDIGESYKTPLDGNGECDIPGEVMSANSLLIGVYGVADGIEYPTIWTNRKWLKDGAYEDCPVSDYPEPSPVIETLQEEIDELTAGKVDKPENATEGNVAIFGSNSNIEDSGISKDNLILAPQLASNNIKTDSVPYIYRQTGGGIGVGNREYDSIVGGSAVYAQYRNAFVATTTVNGVTITNNGDHITLNGTASADTDTPITGNMTFHRGGHYLLLDYTTLPVSGSGLFVGGFGTGTRKSYSHFWMRTGTTWTGVMRIYAPSGAVFNNFNLYLNVYDITEMFGSDVALRLYQIEQANTGAGVALFHQLFPNSPNNPYTATPSLESVSGLSSHQMKDGNGNVIAEYPLDDSLTLRGVAVIDDNNNIKFDGDTYAPDGTVTRRYGIVDLGTLTWTYNTTLLSSPCFVSNYYNARKLGSIKMLCALYVCVGSRNDITANMQMASYNASSDNRIVIRNDSYTDATAFKTAMSGVYVIYELATPTTETADPYDSLQICDPLGTEEYVTTGIVPVGHVTQYPENQVAKLDGLPSDFSRIIAPTEKAYKATRTYTVGRLLIVNNILYKVISAISSGATLTVGTNISETTLDEVIASL